MQMIVKVVALLSKYEIWIAPINSFLSEFPTDFAQVQKLNANINENQSIVFLVVKMH